MDLIDLYAMKPTETAQKSFDPGVNRSNAVRQAITEWLDARAA